MRKEIILMGPPAVGKSTTAKLLSEKLNLPQITIDDLRFDYYKEIGYSDDHMNEIYSKAGIMAVYQYGKIFDSHSIERVLEDYENCVFDFGGGNNATGYSFDKERMKKALKPFENVILLFPCINEKEALAFIYERRELTEAQKELFEYLVYSKSNFKLAKHIVYVKDKSPEEVCDEVLQLTQ